MTTKITEISNRAACAVWCPVKSYPEVVALGAKDSGGASFEDTGGELELYDLALTSNGATASSYYSAPAVLGSVKTVARFASVAWSPYTGGEHGSFVMGLLVGGMTDGSIHIWDPQQMMTSSDADSSSALISSVPQNLEGPVSAMGFSSLETHQLCVGSSNGQILIIDLSDPKSPVPFEPAPGYRKQASAEVTAIAWNTQVAHIVATASGDGSVSVWDLKSRKAWCEIRAEQAGQAVADIHWNPSQGLHLLTASADDRNSVIRVWDLAASTSMPLATLTGHAAGLLKTAWCPHDATLLLSCGKDSRTFLWDLITMQPIAEVPADASPQQQQHHQPQSYAMQSGPGASSAGMLFASNSTLNEQKKHLRYDCQWSPFKRGLALTCSLDRKVQIHSITALATQSGRPPAWLKPASSVSTGFGGAVISCSTAASSHPGVVTIRVVQEQPLLAQTSQYFETEMAKRTVSDFCHSRQVSADNKTDAAIWGFMEVMFQANARQELLQHLGFDAADIASQAASFRSDLSNGVAGMSLEPTKGGSSSAATVSKADQELVKKCLLVGNFEAAVDCCFKTGNYADALVLASCGGADLWSQTQTRFFQAESSHRPYLFIVSAVIRSQLDELVAQSDTASWQETLAILATYGQSEDFPKLSVALGDRLDLAGDGASASLCYMCALHLDHAMRFWKKQLEQTQQADNGTETDLLALHDFVVKASVFLQAATGQPLSPEVEALFDQYANVLAEQGLFATAAKYVKGSSEDSKILRDRLYRSRASQRCLAVLGSPPAFPFDTDALNYSSRSIKSMASTRGRTVQSQQQQQASYGQTYSQQGQQQQQQYNQTGYAAAAPTPEAAVTHQQAMNELPPGWIALADPSSGQTYYANQTTGETSWDPPQSPPAQALHPDPNYGGTTATTEHSTQAPANGTGPSSASKTKASLASKYGDGFVTSASHPELAYQYGNVGTSNPYTGVSRPGPAAAGAVSPQEPPYSGTLNVDQLELSPTHAYIKDTLVQFIEVLKGAPLYPTEKKQVSDVEKSVAILVKKLARGALSDDITSQIISLAGALSNRDYGTASAIQTSLAHTEWREQKDWLKGIKLLIQIASKKLYN